MINKGLFSLFFIERIRDKVSLDDLAKGRMATLAQTWKTCDSAHTDTLWNTFLKQALSYLQFVPANTPLSPGVYKLYEDWGFSNCISVVYLIEPESDIDDVAVGRFWPAKLLLRLREFELNWGILTDGSKWRLYSTKSSRPYEDYVELDLAKALEKSDEPEYGLFECFFHKDSFVPKIEDKPKQKDKKESASALLKCQLDQYRKDSEEVLDEFVKKPLLYQIDEVLQYLCNGFIFDTPRKGEEYTEEERKEIFENSVKLLYRCLFLFYAEARKLLPSKAEKTEEYERHSLKSLCHEAHKFQWGERTDTEGYELWMQFKGLINAVNEGDPEYGIMGYNGGLFDDTKERFLGEHRVRNDFFSRALYLLSYVEPQDRDPDKEYKIPYEDLEVRHLGELYENILEYTVLLADTDRIRRRTKKGVDIILASETDKQKGDTLITKGDVYFGESALERKQTGSYYTPESIVQFLNNKAVIEPLRKKFEKEYRTRFNQFLEQIHSGDDDATRRGAGRSAIALIERFVDESVLKFRVCDPAMGSGHFLVDTVNQMVGLVVELLADIPEVNATTNNITCNPNYWRRLITRFCLYGVDLNPLAVDLAKLSLWLNCFAVDHKLTFLDHHLRCGNSLIGIYSIEQLKRVPEKKTSLSKKSKQKELPNFDNLLEFYLQSATSVKNIREFEEDDLELQQESFEKSKDISERNLSPLADLITAFLMNNDLKDEEFVDIFKNLSDERKDIQNLNIHLQEIWNSIKILKENHQYFNWPLEFPDVFVQDGKCGFNAAIGNPPWDIVKPNSQEFFLKYIPEFRKYNKQDALRTAEQLMERNPIVREKWVAYKESFKEQSSYFREHQAYQALGKGDINTFKLFLERFFCLLKDKGRMGILIPSGFYNDKGCQDLRELFFDRSKILFLYSFENRRPRIFNGVHCQFKFALLSTERGGITDSFKVAFMEHDPDRLPIIDKNALKIKTNQIRKLTPSTLTILEFKNQKEVDIVEKIYSEFPPLGIYDYYPWIAKFTREIDNTDDMKILNLEGQGLPLYEGKMINHFTNKYSSSTYWIDPLEARKKLKKYSKQEHIDADFYRVVNRRQASTTNERTMISCVVPPNSFTWDNLAVTVILDINETPPKKLINENELCYLSAIFNSFIFDFMIRLQANTNLSFFIVYSIPVPRYTHGNKFFDNLVPRVARLTCTNEEFSKLWGKIYSSKWIEKSFWYSTDVESLTSYGPMHEQKIRIRIANEVKYFNENWHREYGLYDKNQDQRDTGDRAQLRAEIDAYVAHLYGLTRDKFSYILDTFPVLKRKEKETFGEYMSKRKCLEEYDRVATIL